MKNLVLGLMLLSSVGYASETCKSHVGEILGRAAIKDASTIDAAKSLCDKIKSKADEALKCLITSYQDENTDNRPVITEDEAKEINNECNEKAQLVN